MAERGAHLRRLDACKKPGSCRRQVERLVKASSLGLVYCQIQNVPQFQYLQLNRILKKGTSLSGSHENMNTVFGTSLDYL
jgi:hypothetical protein